MKDFSPFKLTIIAVAVLGAVVGLYFFTTFKGFGDPEIPVGSVTIWGTLPQEAVDAGIARLIDSDERFAEVAYVERPAGSFSQDLANAIAAGAGPDLIIISQEELMTETPRLAPIPFERYPERAFRDAFLPFFDLFVAEEGIYGVPLVLDPLVLYYNRAILSSHRIVNAPSTWEAVSGLALTVTLRDDKGTIARSLIPLGEYANVRSARAILSLLFMQAGNPIAVRSDLGVRARLGLDDEAVYGVTGTASAITYYTQFADPAKTVYSWNRSLPESRAAFVAGDLALYPGFASEYAYIRAANPNLDFDVASMPQPGTASLKVSYGLGYALAIPKASPNPEGAYQVALGLSGGEPSSAIAQLLSISPALRSLLVASPDDPFESVVYDEALTARGWLSPAPYITDAVFSAMIGNIISGRMEVDQALTTADQSLDAALR